MDIYIYIYIYIINWMITRHGTWWLPDEANLHRIIFRMTFFGTAQVQEEGSKSHPPPLPARSKNLSYISLMKLGTVGTYLEKIQKYVNHVIHPMSSADTSIFQLEISNFCYIKKYRYRLQFNTFFAVSKSFIFLSL